MKRILIDTMVVDLIADTPGLLPDVQVAVNRGALSLLVTHLTRDQLTVTRDPARRSKLMAVYDALPTIQVPTRGGMFGRSPWGEFRWGDGGESGVRVNDVRTTANIGGAADALMATTASGDADVLVTGDARFKAKAVKAGVRCEVWSLDEFVAFIKDGAK